MSCISTGKQSITAVAACYFGVRRSQFIAEYTLRELAKVGFDATVYPIGVFPSPMAWLTKDRYSRTDVVISVDQLVDEIVARAFRENGHRREVLGILDIYRRDGKFSEISLRAIRTYEFLTHGREGVERLMAREEVSRMLDLGDVLEMKEWRSFFIMK